MIASSPSPTPHPRSPHNVYSRPSRPYSSSLSTAAERRRSAPATSMDMNTSRTRSPRVAPHQTRDASTQYSPPEPTSESEKVVHGKRKERSPPPQDATTLEEPPRPRLTPRTRAASPGSQQQQQQAGPSSAMTASSHMSPAAAAMSHQATADQPDETAAAPLSPSKRPRPENPASKQMPAEYRHCNPSDLVRLIASMLMELIRHNDSMPIANSGLTRFHSRAPPGISVFDYLQRLTTHATLSPPILLCMVYYIDRLCALWPKFTINSLTVHRYLIASATVASKGLSDSFWTNNTYARVGGVSLKELALLELEFLWRIDWRIVPKPEVLEDYYRSLVERCEGFEIESPAAAGRASAESSSSSDGPSSGEMIAQEDMS